ncbi:MAG: hypothetical protein QXL93_02885 [Candidatus Nitrosocaldus sp.]
MMYMDRKSSVIGVIAVLGVAAILLNMPVQQAHAQAYSVQYTVNPAPIPAPGGTTTITIQVILPPGASSQLMYLNVYEPDGDTCTILEPLSGTGPTTLTLTKIYPTDAALTWNVAGDGCDTNEAPGSTWVVYGALVTNFGTVFVWDNIVLPFMVVPESVLGAVAVTGAGLATFAGYKVLRSKRD